MIEIQVAGRMSAADAIASDNINVKIESSWVGEGRKSEWSSNCVWMIEIQVAYCSWTKVGRRCNSLSVNINACWNSEQLVRKSGWSGVWMINWDSGCRQLWTLKIRTSLAVDKCQPPRLNDQPLEIIIWNKRTECEPSQFGSSREQSSRDKGSSSVFWKYMSTVNWNMFRMCMSIIDWNSSPSFLAPPSPQIKLGGPSQ